MSLFRILPVLPLIFFACSARAGLLFEPYAGYSMGDLKTTDLADVTLNANIDGFAYGARAGWMFGRFFLGGEYQGSRAQKKADGTSDEINWTNTSVFGILGLQSHMGLRISAGITVTPHSSEEATLPERTTFTGSAQKISVGYRYRVPMALNVDYIMYKFDKFKQGSTEGDIKERFRKMDYSALLISISFPFEF